ncbi:hypothetical protein Hanom_Chr02g00129581 [Helianthus anomalus]
MVGLGSITYRNKEVVGMLAIHETQRSICFNSEWIYFVFFSGPAVLAYKVLIFFAN